MHVVRVFGEMAFGKLHKSTQVCTNGSMSVSLYMQSQAKMASIWGEDEGDFEIRRSGKEDIELLSQSNAKISMLLGGVESVLDLDLDLDFG